MARTATDITAHRRLRDAILRAVVAEGKTIVYRPGAGMSNEEPHHFWGHFGAVLDANGLKQAGADLVLENAENRINELDEPNPDSVNDLLVHFLRERPGSNLPDTRQDFSVPDRLRAVMDACCGMNFALPTISRGYRWTECVAPVMRDAGRWNEKGGSTQDERQASVASFLEEREQRGTDFVKHAPDFAVQALKEIAVSEGAIAALNSLNQFNDGKAWLDARDPSVPKGVPTMGLDAGMKLLTELLREKTDD